MNLPVIAIFVIGFFGLSVYLTMTLRRHWAWIVFALATLIVIFPAVGIFLRMWLYPQSGSMDLGAGILLFFVAAPLAAAWLIGLAFGGLLRWINTATDRYASGQSSN